MVYSLELRAHLASAVVVHQPDALGSGPVSLSSVVRSCQPAYLTGHFFYCSGCNGLSFHVRMTVSGTIMLFPQTVSTALVQSRKREVDEWIPLLRALQEL